MNLLQTLAERWKESDSPFLIYDQIELKFSDIIKQSQIDLSKILERRRRGANRRLQSEVDLNAAATCRSRRDHRSTNS